MQLRRRSRRGGVAGVGPQLGVVGVAQAREARAELVLVRADEHVDAGQVDVVLISIRLPGPTSARSEPAALVSTRTSAPAAFSARTGGAQLVHVAALVEVRAALEHRHRHAADAAEHRAAGVPCHARAAGSRAAPRRRSRRRPPPRRPPAPSPEPSTTPTRGAAPARSVSTCAASRQLTRIELERRAAAARRGSWSGRPRRGTRACRAWRTRPGAGGSRRRAGRRRASRPPRRPRRSRVSPAATSAPIAEASAHWLCG